MPSYPSTDMPCGPWGPKYFSSWWPTLASSTECWFRRMEDAGAKGSCSIPRKIWEAGQSAAGSDSLWAAPEWAMQETVKVKPKLERGLCGLSAKTLLAGERARPEERPCVPQLVRPKGRGSLNPLQSASCRHAS